MDKRHTLVWTALLLITVVALFAACGGGSPAEPAAEPDAPAMSDNEAAGNTGDGGGEVEEAEETEAPAATDAPEATLTPRQQIPDSLVVHPDAFDVEINPASNTYIYIVPMMVAETTEYMLQELTAKGWQELGKPTIMGHLATLNMQMDKSRLTISMQDNERSQTTRVQMVFIEQ